MTKNYSCTIWESLFWGTVFPLAIYRTVIDIYLHLGGDGCEMKPRQAGRKNCLVLCVWQYFEPLLTALSVADIFCFVTCNAGKENVSLKTVYFYLQANIRILVREITAIVDHLNSSCCSTRFSEVLRIEDQGRLFRFVTASFKNTTDT